MRRKVARMLADDDFVRTLDELDRHGCARNRCANPHPPKRMAPPNHAQSAVFSACHLQPIWPIIPRNGWSDRIDTTCCHESEPFPTSWRRQQKAYTPPGKHPRRPICGSRIMSENPQNDTPERETRIRERAYQLLGRGWPPRGTRARGTGSRPRQMIRKEKGVE